jgi:hypothetical protein
MTEIKKPEELAFAATELISDTATKLAKERLILTLGAGAIAIGIVAASSTIMPAALFAGAFGLWDMNRLRKASLNMREAFGEVAQGLGEHDSVHQMDSLKSAFEKVNGYSKNDLNMVAHYKRNKVNTLLMGGLAIINPLFVPLALSSIISDADLAKLKAVKDSTVEAQKNLRKKYPLTFDPS